MIIELYGCPGSGKSYALKKITGKQLHDYGTRPFGPRAAVSTVLKAIVSCLPSAIKTRKEIRKAIKGCNTKPIFISRPLRIWIKNLAMLNEIYRFYKKKKLIMDEGLIQRVVAMSVNFGWESETVDKILACLSEIDSVKSIYLNVSVDECISSIKKRNRHQSEMDELCDAELDTFIKHYKCLFEWITDKYRFEIVNRNNLEYLMELYNG